MVDGLVSRCHAHWSGSVRREPVPGANCIATRGEGGDAGERRGGVVEELQR